MGRKRAPGNEWMPKGVFFRPSGYYWKPGGTTEKLAPAGASKSEVWIAFEKVVEGRKNILTFSQLWKKFLNSTDYAALAPRTQKDYLAHEKYLLAVFGDAEAKAIKPEHVRRYMDARGKKSRVQANHEHSSMSRVYRWGYQRGFVPGNPCVGVDKFPKPKRDRYITDEEYLAIYEHASEPVKAAMEIAYLCAARVSDVLKMDWSQIMDEGIFIQQGKTGVKQIKAWTERLRTAVNRCRAWGEDGAVIKTMYGERYSYKGFNEAWRKARAAAANHLGRPLDCTFHDLKAKSISDYEGSSRDKQKFSGHKTESQVLVYDRKIKITPTLDK
ncbi:TPA: tyrosine-type recombinase/integrase [Escherichia coli]|uniref:Tyrosine-type recombinase/integrase n=1 Tax=Citrobacter freundii TaxID=546 RepID=A0A9P4DIC6_CITFR|nr:MULTISPECIES: tyrosine-type recombinase/integrase [Enterobacteriaceae]EFA7616248.1 tyrosine-type recombinase/integrase [Escherichia coli]ELK6655970.1 tyrosine-type recombinase/integrase [Citrobacter freundii]MBN4810449.1 tyrosine-type recombinase/integrase [Citrobacter braakii]MBN4815447.1 tyrosine-type recombinase/integrase [Citrobacter braakii]MBN4824947.1 tyrosine-type recombinase/integrase [Citrobacter braakii]